jgi:hypothetical protein
VAGGVSVGFSEMGWLIPLCGFDDALEAVGALVQGNGLQAALQLAM